ncbi:MAG: hypothetical protein RLP45_03260 [Haliea sp.]
MKNVIYMALGAVAFATLTIAPTHADNHMTAQPVELYACTFRDGKGMQDLEKANANFKKWAASNTSGHSAWMITPQFRSMDTEFHVGWIGAYQSAADFGSSTDKWVNASGSVSKAYYDAVDCSHAMMSSYATGGQEGAPGDGVVWFSRCSLEDDASVADAAAGHARVADMMEDMGAGGSSWIFVPGLGFGDAEFDYYHVAAWPSYPAFAKAWEAYVNGGGMAKAMELHEGVSSCKSPNMYDAQLILAPPAAE